MGIISYVGICIFGIAHEMVISSIWNYDDMILGILKLIIHLYTYICDDCIAIYLIKFLFFFLVISVAYFLFQVICNFLVNIFFKYT